MISFIHASEINVTIPIFEGPLDLLLQLIERAELDITEISLAQVTDQYLDHLKQLVDLAAEEVSVFLIIAARLLQIKSEVLLPQVPSRREEDEDAGESLVTQLRTYKRFKEIAKFLENRDLLGLRTYLRIVPAQVNNGHLNLVDLALEDLITAAHLAFDQNSLREKQAPPKTVVPKARFSVRQKLGQIVAILRNHSRATFRSMLTESSSRIEVVVTFLALLELVNRHLVQIHQPTLFAEIEVEPSPAWRDEIDFELEFGE